MNQEKYFIYSAICLLGLIAVGLIWFKLYVSTPHYLTYKNDKFGYTLSIPAAWSGKYEIIEEPELKRVSFMYKPLKGNSYLIFSINLSSQLEWENMQSDNIKRITSRRLAVANDQVYYASWLANNPYNNKSDNRKYLDMVRDLSSIFESFRHWPINLATTDQFCIQVMTTAINPLTGKSKEFPTPCEVPIGWKIVSP